MSHGLEPEIRMGHDIARQFAHLPEQEAAERIATHLDKFWSPAMRRRLARLAADRHPDIDPLLLRAVTALVVDDIDHQELREPSGG